MQRFGMSVRSTCMLIGSVRLQTNGQKIMRNMMKMSTVR